MSDYDKKISELIALIDEEREHRLELEQQLKEQQQTNELLKDAVFTLEDILYGEYDAPTAEQEADRRGGVLNRLDAIEHDELTTSQLLDSASNAQLPIQQLTAGRKAGHVTDQEYKNKYRASIIWSAFTDQAIEEYGKYKLTTKRISRILNQHDLPSDRTTSNRVAEFLACLTNPDPENRDPKHPENLVKLVNSKEHNLLVANQEDLEDLVSRQSSELESEADQVFNRLAKAEVGDD